MTRVLFEAETNLQLIILMILKRVRLSIIIKYSRLILVEKDFRLRWILINVRQLMAGQFEIWSKIKKKNSIMF
jgi:hypothetical protein